MVCPAEIFNGPLLVWSKSSLVCGLQPITGKKWTNELVTRCKSLLFFPVVSTSVPREYRFHFRPPFRVNSPSLHLSVGTCIRYFLTAHSAFQMRTAAKRYPLCGLAVLCTWCQAGRVAKQPSGSYLGFFKWQLIRTDLKARKVMRPGCEYDEKTPLLHVCVLFSWCITCLFRLFKLLKMSKDFSVEFYVLCLIYVCEYAKGWKAFMT